MWTDEGVFNGAKAAATPSASTSARERAEIYGAIRFGAVVENVVMDEETRKVDYDDVSITENTRCAYPLEFIPNAKLPALGRHPNHVILLTCDGYGVPLPSPS